jgi:hypothetical protein
MYDQVVSFGGVVRPSGFRGFAREAVVKLAVLVGSVLSAVVGAIVLIAAKRVSKTESHFNR